MTTNPDQQQRCGNEDCTGPHEYIHNGALRRRCPGPGVDTPETKVTLAMDEMPSWDDLAEALSARLVNHEIGCSGEYETTMHLPDDTVITNRDHLVIYSGDPSGGQRANTVEVAVRAASDLLYEVAAYTDDLRSGDTDLEALLDAVADRLIPVADALERASRV